MFSGASFAGPSAGKTELDTLGLRRKRNANVLQNEDSPRDSRMTTREHAMRFYFQKIGEHLQKLAVLAILWCLWTGA
jgi:hypothetical protein